MMFVIIGLVLVSAYLPHMGDVAQAVINIILHSHVFKSIHCGITQSPGGEWKGIMESDQGSINRPGDSK